MNSGISEKKKTFSGLVWSLGERFATQGVALVISIILSRLLDPSDYGIVSIVTIFTTIGLTFVSSGFSTALVQKKCAEKEDYSTAFIANMAISVVVYFALFFAAPWIAELYEDESIIGVVRVMSLIFPISAFSTVQYAFLQKSGLFKKYAVITFVSCLLSGVAGVVLAYQGFGVYALVWHNVLKNAIAAVLMVFCCRVHFGLRFSSSRLKEMFPFAGKVFATNLMMNVESDLRALIIGKKYSSEDLAFYDKGGTFPKLIVTNLNGAISRVMFPVFSAYQDDKKKLLEVLRRAIRVQTFAVTPFIVGLMAIAKPMTIVLFTEKWLPSVPYIVILGIVYLGQPFENCCKESILSIGKSGIIFMDMAITKGLGLIALFVVLLFSGSVYWMALTTVLSLFASVILYAIQLRKYFQYHVIDLLKDVIPSTVISVVMGILVYLLSFCSIPNIVILLAQIILGAVLYVTLAWVSKNKGFLEVLSILKRKRKPVDEKD